jgi:hypothetical protein
VAQPVPVVEREDVTSIISGIFDIRLKLDVIARNVVAIRNLLDEDDEEEEDG